MERDHPDPHVFAAPCEVGESCGGLGVFATGFIPSGSVLLVETPFALTTAWRGRRHTCAACLADVSAMPNACACDACSNAVFCSDACRSCGNAHSQVECAALAAFEQALAEDGSAEPIADLVLQAIRILSHRHAEWTVRPFGDADSTTVGYKDYAARLQPMRRSKRTGAAIKAAVVVTLHAMPPEARVPAAELFELLNRHQCNAIGVLGAGNASVGLASFLGGSHIFNHSCVPNIAFNCRSHERGGGTHAGSSSGGTTPPRFCFRALADIPEGAELCHCYAGSGEGPSQRQQYLQDHHGFVCRCPRCECDDPGEEAELAETLDMIRCCLDGCGTGLGFLVRPQVRQCIQCGGQWEDEEEEEE